MLIYSKAKLDQMLMDLFCALVIYYHYKYHSLWCLSIIILYTGHGFTLCL
uniref:Uncharacterized protein n=1 Tax=Rhizophora mucronata TaxID=61149 RepID=A0A2P2QXP3_RHIMU